MRRLLLVLLLALCIFLPSTAYEAGTLTVTVLDIGQADAILVLAPNGQAMLVDAGAAVSGQIVLDALEDEGVSSLAYVVATHSHDDHIGAMEDVLSSVPTIGEFLSNGFPFPSEMTADLDVYLAGRGIPIHAVNAGDTIPLDPANVTVTVLNPQADPDTDENEHSVVLRLVHGSTAFLLMGDAGIVAEDRILASGRPVSAQFIKVGHHGGPTTTGWPFLEAVQPSIAVITANRVLSFLPSLTVIERMQDSGADVYSTASSGTVRVTSTRTGYRLETALGPRYPITFPGEHSPPTDPDYDGHFEDANGNRRFDFADVILVFNSLDWITANEPVVWFDFNENGRIDFADVVLLFGTV